MRVPLLVLLLCVPLAVAGCGTDSEPATPEAREGRAVIERARRAHRSDVLDRARITFGFRGDRFSAERRGGRYTYVREWENEEGDVIVDVLTNAGLSRRVNGDPVELSERELRAAETALNSVVYFALLPYNLADPAVQPRLIGRDTLRQEPYDLVEVTFRQEGGGRDWEDRFLYWVHADRSTVDYLAYDFHTGEGGIRFREAVNHRTVDGVRVQDYLNYAPETSGADAARLEELPELWERGALRLVSEVEVDDVRVEAL